MERFLGRLRQEKLRLEATKEKQRVRKEESINKQPHRESYLDLEKRSMGYYEESRCDTFVSELSKVINGHRQTLQRDQWLASDPFRLSALQDRIDYLSKGYVGSYIEVLEWSTDETEYSRVDKCIAIESCPDGTIRFHGGWFGSSTVRRDEWQNDKEAIERALEKAYYRPREWKRHWNSSGSSEGQGSCLPKDALISTPNGVRRVQNLKVGDIVWTVNNIGERVATRILKKARVSTASDHQMMDIILDDGRELFVSPGHPDVNGKPLSALIKGEYFDGVLVVDVYTVPYREEHTYDLLPAGPTGGYWANNVLIGSTLSISVLSVQQFI